MALQRAKMAIEFLFPIRNTTNWSCEGNRRIPRLVVLKLRCEGGRDGVYHEPWWIGSDDWIAGLR